MRSIDLFSLIDRRRQRKLASTQRARRRLSRLAVGCGAFALLAVAAGLVAASLAYVDLVSGLPPLAQLPEMFDPQQGALKQPTRVYDRTGQHLLLSLENPGISRRYLSMDSTRPDPFSPQLIRVTLAALDANYWSGPGFSLAALTNPQPVTIPERLVDELLLWREPPGLRRTLRMRVLAAQVVARYGHVQVLEWYLNSAYYGHLAFGADSAARLYLNKSATELSLSEAALLVAASQAPALNPLDAPAAALERQRELLDLLLAQGVITTDEMRQALVAEPRLARPLSSSDAATQAAAFSRIVLRGLSERFGSQRVERGGLRVITTLDYALQLELSCMTRTQLARLTGETGEVRLPDGSACVSARLLPTLPPDERTLPGDLAASAAVFDPQTGQVLALLGDITPAGEAYFLTPHAPGTLLTPFAAITSFARGASPANIAWDIPSSLPQALSARTNPDGTFHGPTRLRVAIANDYLAPQAQLLDQVGAANVWRLAGAFGLTSLSGETSPALFYEGGSVSVLEMAQAYGVLASQGQRAGQRLQPDGDLAPATVLYVEDAEGNPWLDLRQPETQAVVTGSLAYLAHDVLRDTIARRPSLGYPNPLEIGRPSGAKIGQVEDGSAVWTAGYTPQRVAVFWLGLAEPLDERLNPRTAAGMWHALMQYMHRDVVPSDWPEPPGISRVDVCHPSGLLPTQACPEFVTEIFLNGSEPSAPDRLYQVFQINRETGHLATVFTPVELMEARTFFVAPPQARDWAAAASLPVPPADYDAIQTSGRSPNVQLTGPPMFSFVRGEVILRGTAAGEGFRSYQVSVGQGLNPDNWLQVGQTSTEPVVDGELAAWDTQGVEGLYAVRLQVVRSDQTVETAAMQITVDNTPPLVRIPYPINGQELRLSEDSAVTFQVQATDAFGVSRVEWWVDGKKAGESMQPPYVFSWRAAPGDHVVEARAYDLAGGEGRSEQVQFSVVE